MAGQFYARRRRRRSLGLDRLFLGLTTTLFLGLSAAAAWSVWAAFH